MNDTANLDVDRFKGFTEPIVGLGNLITSINEGAADTSVDGLGAMLDDFTTTISSFITGADVEGFDAKIGELESAVQRLRNLLSGGSEGEEGEASGLLGGLSSEDVSTTISSFAASLGDSASSLSVLLVPNLVPPFPVGWERTWIQAGLIRYVRL